MVELREEKRGRTREGGRAWSAEDICCGRWVSRRMETIGEGEGVRGGSKNGWDGSGRLGWRVF